MFKDGHYDADLKTFKATISLTGASGQAVEIDIRGGLVEGVIEGYVEAFGYPETGGTFRLAKDGPLPEGEGLVSDEKQGGPVELYEAEHELSPRIKKVTLAIVRQGRATEQRIMDLFLPVKTVQAKLVFRFAVETDFPNAQWDERVGKLTGQSSWGNGYPITLDCEERSLDDPKIKRKGLVCTFTSQNGVVFSRLLFVPKD